MEELISYKKYFTEHFKNKPKDLLHFACHSHHAWPDTSKLGQIAYWEDSNFLLDHKWDKILGKVVPEAKEQIKTILNLKNKDSIVFGLNTFELTVRLLSTFKFDKCINILSSENEYHSFNRYSRRMEEEGKAKVDRIDATNPIEFQENFLKQTKEKSYDVIFFSHVFFNTGIKIENITEFVNKIDKNVHKDTIIVIDGYHSFCCFPVDLSQIESRAFYLAGGYKYAMAGEGCAFMVCPDSYGLRPCITGWFADYSVLEKGSKSISYQKGGDRFLGATMDCSGIYRFNFNFKKFFEDGLTIDIMHKYIKDLQKYFLEKSPSESLNSKNLVAPIENLGNYLTFKLENAKEINDKLAKQNIMVDYRGNNLRVGFAIYHSKDDVDEFFKRSKDF